MEPHIARITIKRVTDTESIIRRVSETGFIRGYDE